MDSKRISALFVMEGNRPVGVVQMLDLLRIGLV
jgi:signal-transduction protein with cAMP-binding, CBS, and nucleotidyltransferase domain